MGRNKARRAGGNTLRAVRLADEVAKQVGRYPALAVSTDKPELVDPKLGPRIVIGPKDYPEEVMKLGLYLSAGKPVLDRIANEVNAITGQQIIGPATVLSDMLGGIIGLTSEEVVTRSPVSLFCALGVEAVVPVFGLGAGQDDSILEKGKQLSSLARKAVTSFGERRYDETAQALADFYQIAQSIKPDVCESKKKTTEHKPPKKEGEVEQHRPRHDIIMALYEAFKRVLRFEHTPARRSREYKRVGARLRRRALEQNRPHEIKRPFVKRPVEQNETPSLLIYLDHSGTMSFPHGPSSLIQAEYFYALIMVLMDFFRVDVVAHNGSKQFAETGGYVMAKTHADVLQLATKGAICCGEGRVPFIDGNYQAVLMFTDMGWHGDAINDYARIVSIYKARRVLTAVHGLEGFLNVGPAYKYASDPKLVVVTPDTAIMEGVLGFKRRLTTMLRGQV